jgi:ADP-heptose:LPS heptosyltransferase
LVEAGLAFLSPFGYSVTVSESHTDATVASEQLAAADSFLVVRLGAIGDALRVCPAVRRLRRDRPNARIGWAVEQWVHRLIKSNTDVDRFHVLDRRLIGRTGMPALREWRRFIGEVRSERYEVALDFHGRLKSGLVTRASGARWRLGYPAGQSTEGNHFFTNYQIRLHDPLENRVQRFLHLLAPLGIDTAPDVHDLGIPGTPGATQRAVAWYEYASKPELAVFPGTSANQAAYHRWPTEKWTALLRALGETGVRSVVFWGPDEEQVAREIAGGAGPSCMLAPETTLQDLMAMVGQFRAFLGSNTAAMHMAWMQGVPTAYFSGPASPRTDAPLPPVPSRVLRAGDRVRPGVSKRHQADVVASVTVDEALAAVRELLEEACRLDATTK